MKKRYLGMFAVVGGLLCTICGPDLYFAEELVDEFAKGNQEQVISSPVNQFSLEIYPETQNKLNEYINEDISRKETIDEIIKNCKQSGLVDSKELNETLLEFISSASTNHAQLVNEMELANDLIDSNKIQSRVADPFGPAKANWALGASIVQNAGYPNTAMYMRYAAVPVPFSPAPAKHVSTNNGWAKNVITDNGILNSHYQQYKAWVRGNSPTLVVNGSFAFTSGDKYYALHNVNYTYTYIRQPKGNVKCTGVVKDIYDFAWSKYNSITTAIANNYAYTMQKLGLIKPYNIEIRYNWG